MKCPSCGAANLEGKRFCGDCGTALPLSVRCTACGAENPAGKKFCADCGAALTIGASSAPAETASPLPAAPMSSAERRQLTVLFCDLVGSTALASRLDPEDLREIIGVYHRCVADTVSRFDGFVAKYMGDGVLVYFGYRRRTRTTTPNRRYGPAWLSLTPSCDFKRPSQIGRASCRER